MSQTPQNTERVTITLTRYQEPDWLVLDTIKSLIAQKDILADILFFDQDQSSEIQETLQELPSHPHTVIRDLIPCKGLSYARNLAIQKAQTDVLLFIDSDAIALPDWATNMHDVFKQHNCSIVAGRITPLWHRKPLWVSRSQFILDQYSMLDLGEMVASTKKVVGANFGLSIKATGQQCYFKESLGRKDGNLLGGEETELTSRVSAAGGKIVYAGNACVRHQVLPERITYRWITRRIYWQGFSRATLGGQPKGVGQPRLIDSFIILLFLPIYLAGFFFAKIK